MALAAASGWALDRLGVLVDPLAGVENALVSHPEHVVVGLARVAATCRLLGSSGARPSSPG